MSAIVVICSKTVGKYIKHLDSWNTSDNSDSSDSKQKLTRRQDFATVNVINRHNYEFCGYGIYAPVYSSFFIFLTGRVVDKILII